MIRIFFFLFIGLVVSSCNNRAHLGASNYTLEWKDFHPPSEIEDDFEIAVTPELYFEGGGSTPSGIIKRLYGGYVGASAVVEQNLVFGLGGGYRLGDVQTSPNDDDSNTIENYTTNNWQTNFQFGYRYSSGSADYYPVLVGVNYGQDGGDYLGFRQRLQSQTDLFELDTEDLFSFQLGTKLNETIDPNLAFSLYGGLLFNDRSTSSRFGRGSVSIIGNSAIYYKNMVVNLRGTVGFYGGASIGAGYRLE